MFINKAVKFMVLSVVTALGCAAGAEQGLVIRDSDKLHFDVREIVNRGSSEAQVKVQMELCVALKSDSGKGPDKAVCQLIDESQVLTVAEKPADAPHAILRFKDQAQSRRRSGPEVNGIAQTLMARLAQEVRATSPLQASQVEFRLALQVFSVEKGRTVRIDSRYSAFPELTQEAPAEERGLLISRIEPASRDKLISLRVLLVVTRRGQ